MRKSVVLAVIVGAFPMLASGQDQEVGSPDCESIQIEVNLDEMVMADEEALRKRMEKTQQRLEALRRSQPRSNLHRRLLRQHMMEMRNAMEQLHNMMLRQGCYNEAYGASLKVRMEVMEQRMQSMQQMMDQMLSHISELGRQ